MNDGSPAQQELILAGLARAEVRRARPPRVTAPVRPAEVDPVARVLVDVPLAHLDRPFDYLVPDSMAQAVPGARVKVRFAGQDVDGFVLARVPESAHPGRLAPLRRLVSAEPVLAPEIAELTGEIAARWAGTRSDVLRLAVPPRHATTEKRSSPAPQPLPDARGDPGWGSYDGGAALLDALSSQQGHRAVWSCLPGDDWSTLLASAAAVTAKTGRGVLVCVPDHRDVARLDTALTGLLGGHHHVVLTSDAGPAKRYAAFLAVARGSRRIVIGTRAAAFAPVHDLGLVVIWDDGDDLFAEPRAPYPHTREVLLLRARQTGCSAIVGGYARTPEAQYLLRTGWAQEVAAPRDRVRERISASVTGATEFDLQRDPHARTSRLPGEAHRALAAGLERGPVLVQTPRQGYATRLACDRCLTPAQCPACHGPMRITGPASPPECSWCATPTPDWTCPECEGHGLRSPMLGDRRTAEELGRAFPGILVRTSSGDHVIDRVGSAPAIVVATPGAEPVADHGYATVVLLDTWLLLARSDLRAEEEAVRRWAAAAALVRPVADGGRVLLVGDPGAAPVQAVVRWDPAGYAERVIEERQSAHLPPASRMATLTATPEVLDAVAASLVLPDGAECLGPVPVDRAHDRAVDPHGEEDLARLVLRVPRAAGAALSATLLELQRGRSARKLPHVRVEVDPHRLG